MSVTTENPSINGVDVATLFATLDAVKGQNEIADVPVPRHQHVGQSGTHSRSKFSGFYGAMQEMEHAHETEVVSDHPAVLVGRTTARPRSSTCCTASPPASPRASPTSRRPAA